MTEKLCSYLKTIEYQAQLPMVDALLTIPTPIWLVRDRNKMDPFNNNFQSQVTGTSDTHKTEPPTDFTQEKTSAHRVGRSIVKARPNSHLQSEARSPKNGKRLPSVTSLFSRVISKIKPKAQLKNQQPPVISLFIYFFSCLASCLLYRM